MSTLLDRDPAVVIWEDALSSRLDTLGVKCVSSSPVTTTEKNGGSTMNLTITRNRAILAIVALLAIVLAAMMLVRPAIAGGSDNPPPRAHWMKAPCPVEDGTNCQWNAGEAGNGVGHSFYNVTRPLIDAHGKTLGKVQCIYYVKLTDHHWDACHVLPRHWHLAN